MAELESTHQKEHAALYNLSTEQLLVTAEDRGVDEVTDELSRLRMVKLIKHHLIQDAVEVLPDGGLSMLQAVLEAISTMDSPVSSNVDDPPLSETEEPAPSKPPCQLTETMKENSCMVLGMVAGKEKNL